MKKAHNQNMPTLKTAPKLPWPITSSDMANFFLEMLHPCFSALVVHFKLKKKKRKKRRGGGEKQNKGRKESVDGRK